MQAEGSLPYS